MADDVRPLALAVAAGLGGFWLARRQRRAAGGGQLRARPYTVETPAGTVVIKKGAVSAVRAHVGKMGYVTTFDQRTRTVHAQPAPAADVIRTADASVIRDYIKEGQVLEQMGGGFSVTSTAQGTNYATQLAKRPVSVAFGDSPWMSYATGSEIVLGANMRNQMTLLHELAHVLRGGKDHGDGFYEQFGALLDTEMPAHANALRQARGRSRRRR